MLRARGLSCAVILPLVLPLGLVGGSASRSGSLGLVLWRTDEHVPMAITIEITHAKNTGAETLSLFRSREFEQDGTIRTGENQDLPAIRRAGDHIELAVGIHIARCVGTHSEAVAGLAGKTPDLLAALAGIHINASGVGAVQILRRGC